MAELTDIFNETKNFYIRYVDSFGEGWPLEYKLPQIIIPGKHGNWISFKNSVKSHSTVIFNSLQSTANEKITVNLIKGLFDFYLKIIDFIKERRTDIPEDEVRDTSREGIALELKQVIIDTINTVTEICPEVRLEKKENLNGRINKTPQNDSDKKNIDSSLLSTSPRFMQILKELEKKNIIRKNEDGRFKWLGRGKLYGYFIDLTSSSLNIRPSNNRIPWKKYSPVFSNHEDLLQAAKQGVNEYKNYDLAKPEGFEMILELCGG